jgi:hypothetical protein
MSNGPTEALNNLIKRINESLNVLGSGAANNTQDQIRGIFVALIPASSCQATIEQGPQPNPLASITAGAVVI